MEGSIIELSKWRWECAIRDLKASEYDYEGKQYENSVNRSYYAIFHALRAVTILQGFDSKKHTGIIAYFNEHYVKEGIFDKNTSKIVRNAFELRSNADYKDFYVVSKVQAEQQIKSVKEVHRLIKPYLEEKWK